MARNILDGTGWLVEQRSSALVKAYTRTSVVDSEFTPITMTANIMEVPRIADMDVSFIAKGAAYPEDESQGDLVTITARKIGAVLRIAEEDVEDDKLGDYVELKKQSAGSSFAKKFDNAALGVNAAPNGVVVPYLSAYRALTTADATTGYTANANHLSVNAAGFTITALSDFLALVENGDFFDAENMVWIASPLFRSRLRNMVDGQGRPILLNDWITGRETQRLMDLPIRFTRGARVTTVPTTNPSGALGVKGTAGNPLLFLVQKSAAIVGRRKAMESVYIPGRDGTSALTDEDLLKVRARIAAGLTTPVPHAVLELIATV